MSETESTTIPWTVGRLREALAAYDADTPLKVAVPDFNDGVLDDRYDVVDLGFGEYKQDSDSDWVQDHVLTLEVAIHQD